MNKQSTRLMSIRILLGLVTALMFIGTGLLLLDALSFALSSNEKGAAGSLANAAIFFSLGVFALAIAHGIPTLLSIERNTWLALSEDARKKLQSAVSEQAYEDQVFEYSCEWPEGCSNGIRATESSARKAGWAIIHEQTQGGLMRCTAYCPTHVKQGPERFQSQA